MGRLTPPTKLLAAARAFSLRSNIRNRHGQATVEFLFAIFFIIGILMLFLMTGLSYTAGYLVHMATFMASRAYLVSDSYSVDQPLSKARTHVETMFKNYVSRPTSFIKIAGGGGNGGDITSALTIVPLGNTARQSLFVGVYFEFQQNLSVPLLGSTGFNQKMNLVSESFLGKEPPRGTCLNRINDVMMSATGKGASEMANHATYFDDGC